MLLFIARDPGSYAPGSPFARGTYAPCSYVLGP